jgi:hypothetical protein
MIRVFIGAPPRGDDAEQMMVAEYTLRKFVSEPVDITWLIISEDPVSPLYGWARAQWATPFSGLRWAVPHLCEFAGRAIYLDCDIIVQDDIAKLWNLELWDCPVAARGGWRYCVTLFDCQAVKAHMLPLDALKSADGHSRQMGYFRARPQLTMAFGSIWNYLDDEDRGPLSDAGIVHYTALPSQPSRKHSLRRLIDGGLKHWYRKPTTKHPRAEIVELYENALAEAISEGYAPEQYLRH